MCIRDSRKAMYYGLDLTNYWKRTNAVDPLACENNFYTMKGLCYTSDGTDYVELVRKEMGLPEENLSLIHIQMCIRDRMKAMYGIQNSKMKNWETNANGYTSEEMQEIKEKHDNREA